MSTASEPRFEWILRNSRLPPFPCSVLPANVPMSDFPVTLVK
jgi:hypothetical protein